MLYWLPLRHFLDCPRRRKSFEDGISVWHRRYCAGVPRRQRLEIEAEENHLASVIPSGGSSDRAFFPRA
jgi:hypothetical protein